MMERPEYHGESELEWQPIPENKGLLHYLRANQPEIIIVPEKVTKEMLEDLLKGRPERNHYYPPNTPEMEAIILRMIEELPDGTYKIKTTRDDLDNSKS